MPVEPRIPISKTTDIPNDDGSAEVEGHGFRIPSPLTENDAPESAAPEGEVEGHGWRPPGPPEGDADEVEGHVIKHG